MDSELLTQALNYHGQEFRRVVSEKGPDFLKDIDMRIVNYFEYHRRAKEFGFQERKRRQKLYEFLGKKAHILYKSLDDACVLPKCDDESNEVYAVMPPMESYMGIPGHERKKHLYELIKKGDPVIGKITGIQNYGFVITLLCLDGGKRREIHDLGIKSHCGAANVGKVTSHDKFYSSFHLQDLVRGAVLNEVTDPGTGRLHISMKNDHLAPAYQNKLKLGLITEDDLPLHYRKAMQFQGKTYSEVLESSLNFNNPTNTIQLCLNLGINGQEVQSLTKTLHDIKYDKDEYAVAIRRLQSNKWAFKSVKDGVAYFKSGNHVEAYQCLNKALQIDPENVEAFVARGALFANNNNIKKAIEDFEKALEINPLHGNAQKYLSETLVALGKCCEEKGDIEEACKNYKRAISINNNSEAVEALVAAEKSRTTDLNVSPTTPTASNVPTVNKMMLHNQPECSKIDDIETRQKLISLLQQEKEKSRKKKSIYSSSNISVSPVLDKMSSGHPKEVIAKYKNYDKYKYSKCSPKYKKYNEVETMQQIEDKSSPPRRFRNEETRITNENEVFESRRKNEIYSENKCLYPASKSEMSSSSSFHKNSLEERLKQYYKKVGEDNELSKESTSLSFSSSSSSSSSSSTSSKERCSNETYPRNENKTDKELSKLVYVMRNEAMPLFNPSSLSNRDIKAYLEKKKDDIHVIQNIKKETSKSKNGEQSPVRWFSQSPESTEITSKKRKQVSHSNDLAYHDDAYLKNDDLSDDGESSDHSSNSSENSTKKPRTETKKENFKYDKSKSSSHEYYEHSSSRHNVPPKSRHFHEKEKSQQFHLAYHDDVYHKNDDLGNDDESSNHSSNFSEKSAKKSRTETKKENFKYDKSKSASHEYYEHSSFRHSFPPKSHHFHEKEKSHHFYEKERSYAHSYEKEKFYKYKKSKSPPPEDYKHDKYFKSHYHYSKNFRNSKHKIHKENYSKVPRKDKVVISRAPDLDALKRIQEAAQMAKKKDFNKSAFSKSYGFDSLGNNSEEKHALKAAMAAAQKINEVLQAEPSTPPEIKDDSTKEYLVMPAKQRETLQQMEMFLEKLKAQKKAELSAQAKD
ncbi:tetratricopeptide repeat protein 14 [Centruroides vittatus]|uniref:tetratricopeptide repeat protein 14 n=1 Tax=Centruroides vittatus TaxID=120091 RepID=UPI00350F2133